MCGCGCDETEVSNVCSCNIIWANATTVDTVSQPWDIVVSSPNIIVESTDNSVDVTTTVTPTSITYDLSKPCCPDLLVAVAPGCTTWGTIEEVIQVDTSWPLTWTQNGCDFWALGFDVNSLNAPDEKVAAKAWCPWKYLEDILDTNNPAYMHFEENTCNINLVVEPVTMFYADIHTIDSSEYTGLDPISSWFVTLDVWNTTVDSTIPSWIWIVNYGAQGTANVVNIWRDWWYMVTHGWSAVVGKWIHTLRSQVWIDTASGDSYPLLDDRFEWSWYKDWDADNVIDLADLENMVSENSAANTQSAGMEAWLARWIRWHGFGQARTVYLHSWDRLSFFGKYNTAVRESTSPAIKYEFWYTAQWVDTLTLWGWSGTFRSVAELPLWKVCD